MIDIFDSIVASVVAAIVGAFVWLLKSCARQRAAAEVVKTRISSVEKDVDELRLNWERSENRLLDAVRSMHHEQMDKLGRMELRIDGYQQQVFDLAMRGES